MTPRTVLMTATLLAGLASPTLAQEANTPNAKRELVGVGWLFSDDLIGDDNDRWRSAALAISWVSAPNWTGSLPQRFGEVIEFRAYTEMLTSEDLVNPVPTDRPYAGVLGFGVHTHFSRNSIDYAVGAELVAVGPQTGVDSLQREFHKLIGSIPPGGAELDEQIEDGFHPTVIAEAGRNISLGPNTVFRPFGEARAGDETLLRIGADLAFGQAGQSGLLVRDKGTGQRYRTSRDGPKGFSFIVGADFAYVEDTIYIPEDRGLTFEKTRARARIGGHWQGERSSFFYGATYLSKEFETQREAQVVGSLTFRLHF